MGQLLRLLIQGVLDMRRHPLAHLFTLVTVTMVALLAGVFLMLLDNVNREMVRNRGQVEFQVFWKAGTAPKVVAEQWRRLRGMDGVKEVETYTPDEALRELGTSLAPGEAFDWLEGDNPLPASAAVSFRIPEGDASEIWAMGLLGELRALPGVDSVHYNPLQMDLAQSWMSLSRAVVWPIIGFLGLVVALVVGNTVKLSLINRRDEVEILALVGAKPWYIRTPLLSGGAALGLMGSGAALGLLKLLHVRIEHVLDFAPLFVRIDFLPPATCLGLVGVVTLVAVASSFVAVRG
ncbi:MAG: cell division protein FtsX [Desulfovibrionaceae bacterium]